MLSGKRKGVSGSFSRKFRIINWKKLKPTRLDTISNSKEGNVGGNNRKNNSKEVIFFKNFKMQVRNTKIAPLSEHGK